MPFHYFVECENAIVQQTMIALGKPHKRKLKNANLELKSVQIFIFSNQTGIMYLIFVTGTTGGACVKILCQV